MKEKFHRISPPLQLLKEELTVIELRNKNEQNVISYGQIKKIENVSCEEISNNCNLLIAHIILNQLVHISRR